MRSVGEILVQERFENIEGGREIGRLYAFLTELFFECGEVYNADDFDESFELEKLYERSYFWGSGMNRHVLYLYDFEDKPLTVELVHVTTRKGLNVVNRLDVGGYGDGHLSLALKREIMEYVKSVLDKGEM